jgi:hypothetical protein
MRQENRSAQGLIQAITKGTGQAHRTLISGSCGPSGLPCAATTDETCRREGVGWDGSRPLLIPNSEEILFRQQFVQPGLVDPADDGGFLLAVADALGQRER